MRTPAGLRCAAFYAGRQCVKKARKRGMCLAHYERVRRGGDTRTARQRRIDAAKARIEKAKAMRREIFGNSE